MNKQTNVVKSTNTEANGNRETLLVTGKLVWSDLRKPNELSGKYQITLTLDEPSTKLLQSKGLPVNKDSTDKNRGNYIIPKRSNKPPTIVDSKNQSVSNEIKLGAGSKVRAQIHAYDYTTAKGKRGKALGLDGIQILELVEYAGGNTQIVFDEEEGGFINEYAEIRGGDHLSEGTTNYTDDDVNLLDEG